MKESVTNSLLAIKQNFQEELIQASSPKKSKKPRQLDKKQKETVKLVKKMEDSSVENMAHLLH